jgi:hypothetical protein
MRTGVITMDNQIMERLMMDDALGQLSPDVSALLRAYASISGDDQEHAIWIKLAASAKDALTDDTIPQAPSIQSLRSARLAYFTRISLAAAAVLIVGIALGLSLPLMTARHAVPVAPIAQTTIPIEIQPPPPPASSGDFWSSQRLLAAALAAPRPPSPPRQWNWAFGQPLRPTLNGESK